MININLLYTFLEVVRAGNLMAASSRLAITQPALSAKIRLLEAEVGQSLFLRKKSGMEPNAAGKELLSVCAKLDKNIEHVDSWIKKQRGLVTGTLKITTVSSTLSYMMPSFLETFIRSYPEIKVSLEENVSAISEEKVLSGTHDVGIITSKCKKNSLKVQVLIKENDVIMVCSPVYLKSLGENITSSKIRPEQILWFSSQRSRGSKFVAKVLGIKNFESIGKILLPDMASCKVYAMNHLGVAVMSRLFVQEELKRGELHEIPGFKVQMPIYMISRNEAYQSPLIMKFKEEFHKYCKDLEAKWSSEG